MTSHISGDPPSNGPVDRNGRALLSTRKIMGLTALGLDWLAELLDWMAESLDSAAQSLDWLALGQRFNLNALKISGKGPGAGGIFRGV
jgi:hypothetical protein